MATAGHMKHNRGAHHLSQKVAGEQPVWMEDDVEDVRERPFEDPPPTASLAGLKLVGTTH